MNDELAEAIRAYLSFKQTYNAIMSDIYGKLASAACVERDMLNAQCRIEIIEKELSAEDKIKRRS